MAQAPGNSVATAFPLARATGTHVTGNEIAGIESSLPPFGTREAAFDLLFAGKLRKPKPSRPLEKLNFASIGDLERPTAIDYLCS
jgi:hypothetical protein